MGGIILAKDVDRTSAGRERSRKMNKVCAMAYMNRGHDRMLPSYVCILSERAEEFELSSPNLSKILQR